MSGYGSIFYGGPISNELQYVRQKIHDWKTCRNLTEYGQTVEDLLNSYNVSESKREMFICGSHEDGHHVGNADACQVSK